MKVKNCKNGLTGIKAKMSYFKDIYNYSTSIVATAIQIESVPFQTLLSKYFDFDIFSVKNSPKLI